MDAETQKTMALIRSSSQLKKWAEACRARDKVCVFCGATSRSKWDKWSFVAKPLEVHHVVELKELIETNNISPENWRQYEHILFDVDNGVSVCSPCHTKYHGHLRRNSIVSSALSIFDFYRGLIVND